jgi:putative MFS transporter
MPAGAPLRPQPARHSPLTPAGSALGESSTVVDDSPFTSFHRRLVIYANGGLFCDGYILSGIGVALSLLGPQMHLTATMTGLVGAATLLGILIGGLAFGHLTDRIGRQFMFTADLALFVVASALQFFVTNPTELVALRFILGLAIGADYPIAAALLAELAPKDQRGTMLGGTQVAWYLGACAAYVVSYALLGTGAEAWRWMLASSAVPAAICLVMRFGSPESPRWLLNKGRDDEARATLTRLYGNADGMEELAERTPTRFGRIFEGRYLRDVLFVGVMWLLQVTPLFAIYTFAPEVLAALHLGGQTSSVIGSLAISVFFLVGSMVGLPLISSWGRRPLCIWSFAVAAVAFALLALVETPLVTTICFTVYAIAIGAATTLELLYPAELFPTDIRATATGFATAVSRVGAFTGTFVLPKALTTFGVADIMMACAALSVCGVVLAVTLAPETKGMSLREASTR